MRFKRNLGTKRLISKALVSFLVFLISVNTFAPARGSNSQPTLTKGSVTPRMGRPNIEYLFTVTYTDADNDTPVSIKVFIDQVDYDMEEVDPSDLNYTDGKEYFFRRILGEGAYSIYYTADDGNGSFFKTDAFTLSVTWSVGHYDLIHFIEEKVVPGLLLVLSIVFIVLLILCITSIFAVLQLRRIAKRLEGKGGEEKGEKEKGSEKEERKLDEDDEVR